MCVRVFGIHVPKFAVERWFWEVYMVFESLFELHIGLHSYLRFLLLENLFLKASLTPLRHLLDTLLSVELLKLFLIVISIASRNLVDRSCFCSCTWWFVPRHLLDTCICRRPFPRQLSWYLSTPSFAKNYWGAIDRKSVV